MAFPCNPAIPLLGMYSREMKTHVHTKTGIQMFVAALVIIAQKSTNNPSVCQLMNGETKCGVLTQWGLSLIHI